MKIQVNLGAAQPGWLQHSRQLGYLIRPILGALITADLVYLSRFKVPPLYESGVRYQMEPEGTVESFDAIPVVMARGWGDCDDLCAWRVAELRHHGEQASIRITWKRYARGNRLYHVQVRRAKYPIDDPRSVEDPSAILGMNGPENQFNHNTRTR